MAAAETARLMATLDLGGNFIKNVGAAGKSLGGLTASIAKSRAIAVGLGTGLEHAASAGISALGNAIGEGIQGAQELERAQAQTQAAITSTGHAAGLSAQQIRDLANALEDTTTVDDKTIQQGENLLLTFTKIGKGVFPEAARAAVNMAVAFNKGDAATADIDSAAIQLGKALNDPATGFTALKRAGVSFSDAQIKILKGTNSLTKEETKHYRQLQKSNKAAAERYKQGILSNNLLKSQKLILGELNTEFGKAGAAAGKGFVADMTRFHDAVDDAKITLAQGLMPALSRVAQFLTTKLKSSGAQKFFKDLGENMGKALEAAVKFAEKIPWDSIAAAIKLMAQAAGKLLDAFLKLPKWAQTAIIAGALTKITIGAIPGGGGGGGGGITGEIVKGAATGIATVTAKAVGGAIIEALGPATAAAFGTAFAVAAGIALATAVTEVLTAWDARHKVDQLNLPPGASKEEVVSAIAANNPVEANTIAKRLGIATSSGITPSQGGTQGDMEARRGDLADALQQAIADNARGFESVRGQVADSLASAETAVQRSGDINAAAIGVLQGVTESGDHSIQSEVGSTASTQYAATLGGTSQIVGAIQNIPAPQTTVTVTVSGTTITKKTTVTNRGGNPTTSRNGGDSGWSGQPGGKPSG